MSKSILIVDDEPMARQLIRLMLKKAGYLIDEAEDGYVALEKVKANQPDVMILDVMMPGIDGLSVCRTLRGELATADLPIIILSAKTTHVAIQEGLAAGANRYLTKPVVIKELLGSIEEILSETVVLK